MVVWGAQNQLQSHIMYIGDNSYRVIAYIIALCNKSLIAPNTSIEVGLQYALSSSVCTLGDFLETEVIWERY